MEYIATVIQQKCIVRRYSVVASYPGIQKTEVHLVHTVCACAYFVHDT